MPNLAKPNGALAPDAELITEFQGLWLDAERLAFSETYPAVHVTVPVARAGITEYAAGVGATGEQLDAVRLGVTEAVTNVVRHAYRGTDGQVRLTACVVENELWVLVADDGCGHHAPPQQPGLGQGILLMAKISAELMLAERADGGTDVRMRFAIGDDGAGHD